MVLKRCHVESWGSTIGHQGKEIGTSGQVSRQCAAIAWLGHLTLLQFLGYALVFTVCSVESWVSMIGPQRSHKEIGINVAVGWEAVHHHCRAKSPGLYELPQSHRARGRGSTAAEVIRKDSKPLRRLKITGIGEGVWWQKKWNKRVLRL